MLRDPIVHEVRTHRRAIAREHGNDLKAIITALKRKQGAHGRRVVSFAAQGAPARHVRRKTG